jgi:hypothetical protein
VSALQGGLFIEPKRWLTVPDPGAAGWWGVDVRKELLTVGTVGQDLSRTVDRLPLGVDGPSRGERLFRGERQVERLVEAMLGEGRPVPGAVWVEQASGQHPNPDLLYVVATATASFYRALRNVLGYPVFVDTVPSATWKAATVGGRVSKKDPATGKEWRPKDRYPVLVWARTVGYEGSDWDDADAYGVAEGLHATVGYR